MEWGCGNPSNTNGRLLKVGLAFYLGMGERFNSEKTCGVRIKLWKKSFQMYFHSFIIRRDGW